MAVYTPEEIKDILSKLAKEPARDVKFKKFERLGVLIEQEPAEPDDIEESEVYACSVCRKKLISAHLLDLHVLETHDTYFDLQKDKKPMYSCYLEECKVVSSTPEERKDHCIKVHKFPHDFRFDKVSSRKKSPIGEKMDTAETATTTTTSTNQPKLKNFHFGHKSQKAFSGRSKKPEPLESMNVDLKDSLPEV